eukprot:UN30060
MKIYVKEQISRIFNLPLDQIVIECTGQNTRRNLVELDAAELPMTIFDETALQVVNNELMRQTSGVVTIDITEEHNVSVMKMIMTFTTLKCMSDNDTDMLHRLKQMIANVIESELKTTNLGLKSCNRANSKISQEFDVEIVVSDSNSLTVIEKRLNDPVSWLTEEIANHRNIDVRFEGNTNPTIEIRKGLT